MSHSDATFRRYVQWLKQCQDDIICGLSKAVMDVVVNIFEGPFDPSNSFAIDALDEALLSKHPKGSPEILATLSRRASLSGR